MNQKPDFFDFAAEVGMTKHIGSLEATRKLLSMCNIAEAKTVLDVGCGAGATPAFIAKEYGCQAFGVDIKARMVERANEAAARAGVSDLVDCRVGDAQDLPFDDDFFDIVITESVTAFPEDKQKAVNEYVRVTKPGGWVGLNETTWLQYPPEPEMEAWVEQDIGGNAKPQTTEAWIALLENAGLQEIESIVSPIQLSEETKGLMGRYGCRGMLRIFRRLIGLYIRSSDYRAFVKNLRQGDVIPENIEAYLGYGLYVGRKPR
jgi:ubiquinone/menaquinone biosynthesis C-methylase UbiE